MREIKFRGKRVDDGEWVYGSLIIEKRSSMCLQEYGIAYTEEVYIYAIINNHYVKVNVVVETVGQYTVLKDKNGKEIYEGDNVVSVEGTIYEVMFDPEGYWCLDGNGARNSEMLCENLKDGCVHWIGTIFDKED